MNKDQLADNITSQGNNALLERHRINALLATATKSMLVVVTAGTGYGKTWAVQSFLRDYDVDAVWMQISEGDNSKSRFWEHFCHSVGTYSEGLGAKFAALGFPERPQMSRYNQMIADDMVPNKKYVMAFDDCHLLTNPDVLQFVELFLTRLHKNITIIIISRIEPAVNIVPLIMKGNVSFITEDDLRFTKQETAAFYYRLGIELSAESLGDIYEDTKGWAFSVNLIGLSLRKAGANERYARTAMRSNVFKLMDAEIFSAASEGLQRFLVRLSLIDHLSASLVRSLAYDPALISEFEEASSFIRYDNYLDAYRIHFLFLEFLSERQDMLTDEEKNVTWRMAAKWCNENGFKIDTVSYYERAGDYDKIIDLITMEQPQQIPYDTAEFLLQVLENAPNGAFDDVLFYHGVHLRIIMGLGRVREAVDIANETVKEYMKKPETPENCCILSCLYAALGLSWWRISPHVDTYDFDKYFEKEYHYYQKFPFVFSGPSSSQSVPTYACVVGTARKGAIEEYIEALARSVSFAAKSMNGCMSGMDTLARGELYFYQADLRKAEITVKNALQEAVDHDQYDVRNRALFYLLRIYLALGKYDQVQSVIEQLEAQLEIKGYDMRQITFDIITSWYYGLMNRLGMTAGWLNDDFAEGALGGYLVDFANLVKAWMFYNTKRYEALLNFVQNESGLTRFLYGRIEVGILEALCHYQLKNREAAYEALEAAYKLSVTNDLPMPFIELGKDMRTLTSSAKKYGKCKIPVEWLDNINRRSATYAKHLNGVIGEYRKANGLDDEVNLSSREQEILADLCTGLSRSEIAAQHGLSINTVKAVLNIIYLKLGAHNNADAVRIAVERNLL